MNSQVRSGVLLVVAAVLCVSGSLHGQKQPDFSGHWKLVVAGAGVPVAQATQSSGRRGSGGRGGVGGGAFHCGIECSISQTQKLLTVTRHPESADLPALSFKLDGTDSSLTQPGRDGGPPTAFAAKARLNGARLLVERSLDSAGQLKILQTIALENGQLRVSTTQSVEGATAQLLTYDRMK